MIIGSNFDKKLINILKYYMFKDTQGKAESKMKAELMSKIKSLVTFED